MSGSNALNRFQQPIRVPGARLTRELALRFVRTKLSAHPRALNLELPLVPFIDFLLCIVLFLLANFGSELRSLEPHAIPPNAFNTSSILEAPLVAIVGTQILVDGVPAGSISVVEESKRPQRIDELFSVLSNKRQLWKQVQPEKPFPGVALLQFDRNVPARVVKSVFQTSAFAGYPNVSFVVGKLDQPAPRG